jgi:hypothetical protein
VGAVRLFRGEEVGGFVPEKDGPRPDRRQSMSLAGEHSPAVLDDARRAARRIIRTNRKHVAGLASLLLLQGKLPGEEVARVLDQPPLVITG